MRLQLIKNHERIAASAPCEITLTGDNLQLAQELINQGYATKVNDASTPADSTSGGTATSRRRKSVPAD